LRRYRAVVRDEFAQRSRWRVFLDSDVESAYRDWHREQILPVARLVGLVSIALWVQAPLSFHVFVGEFPRPVAVSTVIAIPTFVAMLVLSYTRANRWTNALLTLTNIVIGLDFIWVMAAMYGPLSGAVTSAAFATVFYPLILRIRTGAATVVAIVLSSIPPMLLINGIQDGEISLESSWPYIALLLPSVPIIVLSAAQIDAGMRRQFAAERTIERQQQQLAASQRLIRRYAPAAVASRIESGDADAVGEPKRLRATALSSDIAGFTLLADRIDPESLSQIINEYVGVMSGVVEGAGGVITEFAGDGLMAIFGAPEQVDPEAQVRQALEAANAMHSRLAELNESWFRLGVEQPLKVRIGVNTGVLSVGTFGSDGRATYTAIGIQMNIAARIQAQCEPGQTLLSSSSWHLVKDDVTCEPLGEVTVKGVHFPISVYSPR
jgi:class 3 adenylate cyclase